VYRPSELFNHLMYSLQEGLPLWMQFFSLRVTTGHILHSKQFTPVLFFLISTGRGTTTSADIVSPSIMFFVFSLLAHYIKEIYEFLISINDPGGTKCEETPGNGAVMLWPLLTWL
jgi:hypothetical protein